MNKPNQRPENNAEVSITTSLYEPSLLKNLVEKLADLHVDHGYSSQKVHEGYKAVETSTIEAYINGDMSFSVGKEILNVPFVTCFLFTCCKAKGEEFQLSWSQSLS